MSKKRNVSISFLLFSLVLTFQPNISEAAQATRTLLTLSHSIKCESGAPQVVLTWNNTLSVNSYVVHRNPSTSGSSEWAVLGSTASATFNDTGVKSGTTYQYQLQAVGGRDAPRYSTVLSVTVPPCAAPASAAPVQPAATIPPPTRPVLTASGQCASGSPQVTLSWTNPNSATSFTLHRAPNIYGTQTWASLATALSSLSFVDAKVSTGTYQYQLQTFGGPTPQYSEIASVTTPVCTTTPTEPAPQPSTAPATTSSLLKWGAYAGWSDAGMREFETTVVKNPNHMAAFVHWGNANAFPTYMTPYTKDKNRTLVIFWEPSDHIIGGTVQANFSYDAILSGTWDAYIKSFAAQAKAYGAPVILIPFSEMNGNWNPWSGTTNGNTPEKAVLGYRHVRTVFGDIPNVKFGWAPNSNSVPDTAANAIEKYYPGDAYVDITGVDGFNFDNPWMTFDQVFNKPLTIIAKYGKPMYVFSMASAEGTQKAAWITDAITVQMKKYPLLEGFVWFNQNKERDWRISSDSASLTAFKNAVQ